MTSPFSSSNVLFLLFPFSFLPLQTLIFNRFCWASSFSTTSRDSAKIFFCFFSFYQKSEPLYFSFLVFPPLPPKNKTSSSGFSMSPLISSPLSVLVIYQLLLLDGPSPFPHQTSLILKKKIQPLSPSQCGLLLPLSQNSSSPRGLLLPLLQKLLNLPSPQDN